MKNKFLDAMKYRHATKEFDNTKIISDKDFDTILEIGRLSPSSFGFEPWKFVIVQNKKLREKMKLFTWGGQGQLLTSSHFMIILCRKDSMLYSSEYIQHMLNNVRHLPSDAIEKYNQFYKKFQQEDFNLLENDRYLFDWAKRQIYIALGNMMTGAAYMGIDSCPMEGFNVQQTNEFIEKELKISNNEFEVAVMVAFGYRKQDPREKFRQDIEDITAWYK